MNVAKATYEIIYNGTNITGNILPYVLSLTYTDKSKGEADELELILEDSAKLWQNEWYPTKGDKVSAKIYYLGNVLDCGTFVVDETALSCDSAGDIVTIKAIAAGINKKTRTKSSYAHENKTLREIANTIASKHGYSVVGSIEDIRIARETQYKETDLKFLSRLATDYGYTFSVRDNKLIFTNVFQIEGKNSALSIHRSELTSCQITDKTSKSYKAVRVAYHNPKQKQVITFSKNETQAGYTNAKADVLEMRVRAENKQQAEIKANVALYKANSLQQEGTFEMPGNTLVLAGNNCELIGIGMYSGKYYLEASTHTVDKDGGYTTAGDVKRVGLVGKNKQKD